MNCINTKTVTDEHWTLSVHSGGLITRAWRLTGLGRRRDGNSPKTQRKLAPRTDARIRTHDTQELKDPGHPCHPWPHGILLSIAGGLFSYRYRRSSRSLKHAGIQARSQASWRATRLQCGCACCHALDHRLNVLFSPFFAAYALRRGGSHPRSSLSKIPLNQTGLEVTDTHWQVGIVVHMLCSISIID